VGENEVRLVCFVLSCEYDVVVTLVYELLPRLWVGYRCARALALWRGACGWVVWMSICLLRTSNAFWGKIGKMR